MKNQTKYKIFVLILSILLTGFLIILYFLDKSRGWDIVKIFSCIIISIWLFFLPPTILYYVYKIKNSNIDYSVRLGVSIGAKGFLGLLLAPYIGCKAYFINLEEVKFDGKIIE